NLRALEPAWKDGDLAIIHSAGGESDSRSYFEAQGRMEPGGLAAGGWLARFLRARGPSQNPLAAVALAPTLPEALSGAPSAAAVQSLEEFSIAEKENKVKDEFTRELQRLYSLENGPLRDAASSTFRALRRIDAIDAPPQPANAAGNDEKE